MPTSTSLEPVPSSSPPRSLRTIVPDHGRGPYMSASSTQPEPVVPSTTHASSPSPQRRSRAQNNVILPEPVMLMAHAVPRSTVLPSSLSLRHPEPTTPSNLCHPWVHNVVVLMKPTRLHCIFFFAILGLQILILICYIATLLWYATLSHFFDMIHCFCSAALLWCATLSHCFDMLHCHISLTCYIAFVLLHCFDVLHYHIALICYIAFNMSHCFDMLHCFW
jgi:hypothetical protein